MHFSSEKVVTSSQIQWGKKLRKSGRDNKILPLYSQRRGFISRKQTSWISSFEEIILSWKEEGKNAEKHELSNTICALAGQNTERLRTETLLQ